MNKISARDLHLFIGGALALTGFRSLIALLSYFTVPMNFVRIGGMISLIVASLGLAIGIAILKGHRRAMFAAQAYIWFNMIVGCITIAWVWHISPETLKRVVLKYAYDWSSNIVVLGLIFWSRSRKFKNAPGA